MENIKNKFKQTLLYLPALAQLAIFFVGVDIYPFANNEMYAGHPDPENFQVNYLIGLKNGREFSSLPDFQEETLSALVHKELEKPSPDFLNICSLIGQDMRKKTSMDVVRIEQRSWIKISENNVTKPDAIKVLYECKYR